MNFKKAGIAIGVVVFIAMGCIVSYQRPVPVIKPVVTLANASTTSVVAQPNVAWSPYGEQAVAVAGQGLSTSYGGQSPLPTASIAKVMTALAILRKEPLKVGQQGPSITMTAADVGVYQAELAQDESVVPVTDGESLTEYQALEAMLVPSATNVADTMATWTFGSMDNYLAYVNQYATQLGLTQTHFETDASGFSPNTTSTPEDLIHLGEVAMQNPVIAQIVSQRSITLPVAGTVDNFNIDLGTAGIIGMKTGNTTQGGGSFLFTAKYHSLLIVGAIMNAPDLGTALHDAPEVLTSFESALQIEHPVTAGQTVATYALPWGGNVNAVAQKDLTVVDWQGTKLATKTSITTIRSAKKVGTSIGVVQTTYNGVTQSEPVTLGASISRPSVWWRIFHI